MQTYHTHKSEQLIGYGDDVFYSLMVKRTIYEDLSFHDKAWIQKSKVNGSVSIEKKELLEHKLVRSGIPLVIEKEKEFAFDIAKYLSEEHARLVTNLYDIPFDISLSSNGIILQENNSEFTLVPLQAVSNLFFDFDIEKARVVNAISEGTYDFIKVQTGIPASDCNCEQRIFSVRSKIVSRAYEKLRNL